MRRYTIITLVAVLHLVYMTDTTWGTYYKYDGLHRLTKVTYDDGTTILYSYDASGNRTQRLFTVLTDIDVDGDVDFLDFARFASRWLETDCAYPTLCSDADLDWSSQVDYFDLATFADDWLWSTE